MANTLPPAPPPDTEIVKLTEKQESDIELTPFPVQTGQAISFIMSNPQDAAEKIVLGRMSEIDTVYSAIAFPA